MLSAFINRDSDNAMPKEETEVVIVGAGPVGLLIAVGLGCAGVKTIVLEAHESILPASRACVYMPVVLEPLRKLGMLDAIKSQAYTCRTGIDWRTVDGTLLANLPMDDITLLGQFKLANILLEELRKFACVEVRFGLKCIDVKSETEEGYAEVTCSPRGSANVKGVIQAKYVLACDGSNSSVRELLGDPFQGVTYDEWKMIGTDVLFDFGKEFGHSPVGFVVHPEHWAVIVYTGEDGEDRGLPGTGIARYRVTYTEQPGLPDSPDDFMKRAKSRVKLFTQGRTNFEVVRAEPYVNKQRVAQRAMEGRVMLAGDALHSNNPIGGLGLTGGILDAFCYGNALVKVLRQGEPASLLETCATSRQETWMKVTNTLSKDNLERLKAEHGSAVESRNEFFERLNTDESFPPMVRQGMQNMLVDTFE